MTKSEARSIQELVQLAQQGLDSLLREGPEAVNPFGVSHETGLRNVIKTLGDFATESLKHKD